MCVSEHVGRKGILKYILERTKIDSGIDAMKSFFAVFGTTRPPPMHTCTHHNRPPTNQHHTHTHTHTHTFTDSPMHSPSTSYHLLVNHPSHTCSPRHTQLRLRSLSLRSTNCCVRTPRTRTSVEMTSTTSWHMRSRGWRHFVAKAATKHQKAVVFSRKSQT